MRKNIKLILRLSMICCFSIADLQACKDEKITEEEHLCSITFSKNPTLSNYEFSDLILKTQALQPRARDFERLEFLGDRVLGLITAHLLYNNYLSKDSGWLAENFKTIVSKPSLVRMYNDLDIETAELASPFYQAPLHGAISEKIASDVVEALIGAIYIDSSFEIVSTIGKRLIASHYDVESEKQYTCAKTSISSNFLLNVLKPHNQTANFKFQTLQKAISYDFNELSLLSNAFCHSSVGNQSFKRLDFLGVQVLALAVANHVFTTYPEYTEGFLTKTYMDILNNNHVEHIFQNWRLWRYLKKQTNIMSDILCPQRVAPAIAVGTVRTLLGAVYLDGGWQQAKTVAYKLLFSNPSISLIESTSITRDETSSNIVNNVILENRAETEHVLSQVISIPTIKPEEWPSLVKNDIRSYHQPVLQVQNQLNYKQALLKVDCSRKPVHTISPTLVKREEWPALNIKKSEKIFEKENCLIGKSTSSLANQSTYKQVLIKDSLKKSL